MGHAYYAKRQLQSATDAAALAGAQDLPVTNTAINTATAYAAANTPANLSGLQFTYTTKCTTTAVIATGCNAASNPNALVVSGTASTDTWFAKVFGEANIGSVYGPNSAYPQGNADDQQPCQTAINEANAFKARGTTIYSIGYALGGAVNCTAGGFHTLDASDNWVPCTQPEADCYHYASPTPEAPPITSYTTLTQIASPGNFYNQPTPGDLDAIFAAIATDIGQGSSRLVDDGF